MKFDFILLTSVLSHLCYLIQLFYKMTNFDQFLLAFRYSK